ncbi:MAG: ROK family glucokinase [Lachnospiraceae bacterium]|jgi:glucokinase
MVNYCFGIDLGGTSVKCGLFTVEGEVVDKWEIKTHVENEGTKILPDIARTIRKKMQERELTDADVKGVGIGIPGPVDKDGKIPGAVNLHWGPKDIEGELSSLCGLPVKAGNDANVAALGEMWKGGGAGAENMILATLGTGVGGGIIVNGKMLVGYHGAGGEIGHASVNPHEEEYCNCGNRGCLEQYASATGIARLARRALKEWKGESSLKSRADSINAKVVFDAYKAGDALAAQVVEEFARILGRALANFACVADPEVIVLGGGVSKAGEVLTRVVKKYYQEYAFLACKEPPIVLAQLGNDAGIYGAARLVLDM